MIIYFADRHLNILGQASTHLPKGVRITDDLKTDDVDTGVSIFECDIHFDRKTRAKVEEWAEVGNYILRSADDEAEFYNIIDAKIDTKKQTAYIYAEDDGLDLLNDVAEAYTADQYYPISTYVERFAAGAGFEIGINEVEGLTRKLSWDSEQTASARLLSIAEAFNNCEISFSFEINGLKISKKYINIYEKRGKDTGIQLRLNKEIDSIVTTKTIAKLATALKAKGGTADGTEEPITLLNYEYDDGDFYVDGAVLKSRKALEKWSRFLWKGDDTQQLGGHIVKSFSYNTTSRAVLCEKTVEELKKVCDMEINYETDITKFPENVKVGDRVNIIDDDGNLYLSSRVLILETSETEGTRRAVLGEHLIRKSGISQKVQELAEQFAKSTVSVQRAVAIAETAKTAATEAKSQVDEAIKSVEEAQKAVEEVADVVETAKQSAAAAQEAANAAQTVVDNVETRLESLEGSLSNAQQAAANAQQAAVTATQKAAEAETAAQNAATNASEAEVAAENAQNAADSANSNANAAVIAAGVAKSEAEEAQEIAIAAKIDAEQAEKEVSELADKLGTLSHTMKTEYARKTDLTETTADLQTQISQNAAEIESSAYKLMVVDETANNAVSKLEAAQNAAALAQQQADEATAEATAAQQAADSALAAANNAQAEADSAQAAYETARSVADEAEAALLAARKDLETISSRADATEEEITAAQAAVTAAQATADTAKAEADEAAEAAEAALNVAIEAVANADKAQAAANDAVNKAALAQAVAAEAKGNADEAQAIADEAAAIAAEAQETADTAKIAADEAQATATAAYSTATEAQETASAAQQALLQASTDLETAEMRLAEVLADVDATVEEVEAARANVTAAQNAVNEAKTSAETAQSRANAAKADADNAQAAADVAREAAENAQTAANEAQRAADIAKGYVYALEKRTIEAETNIKQNSEGIELRASKEEVAEMIGDVSKRVTASESLIKQLSDSISMLVSDQKQYFKVIYNLETGEYTATSEMITEAVNEVETEAVTTTGKKVFSYTAEDGTSGYCIIVCKSSLMTQTSSGWTFSTSAIESAIKGVSDGLEKAVKELGETEAVVSILNESLGGLTDYINLGSYVYKNEQGNDVSEPSIELGQQAAEDDTESEVHKLIITNKRILFKVGAKEPTEIVSDGINTENITIKEELRQTHPDVVGAFVWSMRANGNYGLSWKGEI